MIAHLLQNLGVPAAAATAVGTVAMLVRAGMSAKGRPAPGGRRQKPPGDDQ